MAFRFEGLAIYQMARDFAETVYAASAKFPRKEEFGLTSQINRAVNSISLNIAEGWQRKATRLSIISWKSLSDRRSKSSRLHFLR